MEKLPIMKVGGSIDTAIKGEYNLDVVAILKEAWQITLKSRMAINLGLFFCLFIGMFVSIIASAPLGGIEEVIKDPQSMTLLNIIVTLVVYPFLVGVEMMGVFHSVGLKTRSQLVFAFLKRGSWVAVCALLTSTLVTIGLTLFYLPGIFLAVALSLALPLVVEKRLSPMKAITVCIQATRFQWFKLFSIYLLLALAVIISALPVAAAGGSELGFIAIAFFLFCLTFIAPMFYNVKGILYREIFGLQTQSSTDKPDSITDTFSA
ncbi:hypothetical protein [Cognaticolwellia mytili]|uniref:hypothetical protein n=1 Tax=Cognaticolwellia mytili TaxID=1888913 RepID=UPI000A16F243|nr:hypothetical protein [Cognaticolwellia mytili]